MERVSARMTYVDFLSALDFVCAKRRLDSKDEMTQVGESQVKMTQIHSVACAFIMIH